MRTAPGDHDALLALVRERVPIERMPLLVGVGDTVTSTPAVGGGWLRGGSDRGFPQLLQDLGRWSGQANRVVLVDSSHGEVDCQAWGAKRWTVFPTLKIHARGRVDARGPSQYIDWFVQLAELRLRP